MSHFDTLLGQFLSGNGGGEEIEYEEGTYKASQDITLTNASPLEISFSKTHEKPPTAYFFGWCDESDPSDGYILFQMTTDFYNMFGTVKNQTYGVSRYGYASGSSSSQGGSTLSKEEITAEADTNALNYWFHTDKIIISAGNTNKVIPANKKYSWKAVWL